MTAAHVALLLAAGLVAGTVNAVAGGGSLVTFPALLSTGLAQIPANVTNSVAVTPGYFASVYGSRIELRELAGARRLASLGPTTAVGAARNRSSVVVSQVKPEAASARE